MERSVFAVALWSANVSANAAPIETEPADAPSACEVAFAIVVAVYSAESTSRMPPAMNRDCAVVCTFESATAIAGTTETPGPDAPARANASPVCVADAASVKSPPFVSSATGPHSAIVRTVVMLSATDAPMPTLDPPAPVVLGSARASVAVSEVAWILTSPPFALIVAKPVLLLVMMLAIESANEPATPIDPPPAPLVAVAVTLGTVLPAAAVKPFELASPLKTALLLMLASVIATPAPTFAEPPAVASPLAWLPTLANSLAKSSSAPPLVIGSASATNEFAPVFVTFTAIAAATLIDPLEVLADGVAPAPLESPAAPATPFACERSAPT